MKQTSPPRAQAAPTWKHWAAFFFGACGLQLGLLAAHPLFRVMPSGGPGWGSGAGIAALVTICVAGIVIFGGVGLLLLGWAFVCIYIRRVKAGGRVLSDRPLVIATSLLIIAPTIANLLFLGWGMLSDAWRY